MAEHFYDLKFFFAGHRLTQHKHVSPGIATMGQSFSRSNHRFN